MDGVKWIRIISVMCVLFSGRVCSAEHRSLSLSPGVFPKPGDLSLVWQSSTQPAPFLYCSRRDTGFPRIALAFRQAEKQGSAAPGPGTSDERVPLPVDAEKGTHPDDTGTDSVDEGAESEDEGAESDDAEATPLDEGAAETPSTLFRPEWHELGPITADCVYTGEVFSNARGGITTKNATRYRGDLSLTLQLDTEKADWWDGGEFLVYLQHDHGRTLTQNFVGDGQYYSSIDTGLDQSITQLGEYTYQHTFGEGLGSVKVGRQDANEHFAFASLGGDFLNSSFITLANIPLPTWPYQTLGVLSLWQADSQLRLGGGVYDHGQDRQQWWSSTTDRGLFMIGQMDYEPFADDDDALLTVIRVGSWYTTSSTLSLTGASSFDGNYGVYTTLDQMLLTEHDDDEQGLGAFLQFSWAPSDRNQVDLSHGAGLVCRGLFPGHDQDTLGLGYTLISFSSAVTRSTGQTSENAVELFYKARVREWISVQPDLQYIVRPNGLERDAIVTGLRCEIAF